MGVIAVVQEAYRAIARNSLLVQSLPQDKLEELLTQAVARDYDRGGTLFLQGEEAKAIHIILEGWVKLYRIASNGAEAVVSVFAKGESFGEAVALRYAPYPVSAEAVTQAKVLHVPTHFFTNLMKEDPAISISMLASTFSHLHSLVEQLEHLKEQTGAQRVAEFLLELCECESGTCTVTLPYDKVLIAGKLGMKPESLSRAFRRLKSAGVVIEKNHAVIENIDRLRMIVEAD
jgi:CRP-like cAMP-binding protein